MKLDSYRSVLSLPGVRSLMVLALLGRVPLTATGVTLTLHVVGDMHLGYAEAGLIGTAGTAGAAIGAPLLGRIVDRRGLRLVLVVTAIVEVVFWFAAPGLPYLALLITSLLSGVLSLPIFSIVRQSLAAIVPAGERRQAYALDSMSVELSYMAGPTLAVLVVTQTSASVAMMAIGACLGAAGVAMWLLNPAMHGGDGSRPPGPPPRRREWVSTQLLAVLAATVATTIVLAGSDVSVVAVLRQAGAVGWTGGILALWGLYSLVGGFIYGARPKAAPLVLLVGLLTLFTFPVGFVGHQWGWLALTLLPAGALCAPTLSSTSDAVSKLVPPGARGEAMGWQGSALTFGMAIGAPLAGWAIDVGGPAWGFAAVSSAGAVVTVFLLLVRRRLNATTGAALLADETVQSPGPVLAEEAIAAAQLAGAGTGQLAGGGSNQLPDAGGGSGQLGAVLAPRADGELRISERHPTKV